MRHSLKKIVCLAKSRKLGGLCFAGKEILRNNIIGNWIRPISLRESEEISPNECEYENGCRPDLLDIIEIPMVKHKPTCFQCENYLIDDKYFWLKDDVFNKKNLVQLCDHPKSLWEPHDSTYYGVNDRVREAFVDDLKNSLYLITPSSLSILVQNEGGEFGNPKQKVRARFKYNGENYLFPITDPDIEEIYYRMGIGRYPIQNPEDSFFLCVSIGLPYDGYCYKFVASIIK